MHMLFPLPKTLSSLKSLWRCYLLWEACLGPHQLCPPATFQSQVCLGPISTGRWEALALGRVCCTVSLCRGGGSGPVGPWEMLSV